jgi:hypothetical protein
MEDIKEKNKEKNGRKYEYHGFNVDHDPHKIVAIKQKIH